MVENLFYEIWRRKMEEVGLYWVWQIDIYQRQLFKVKMYFQAWVPAWTLNKTVKWDSHLTFFGKTKGFHKNSRR